MAPVCVPAQGAHMVRRAKAPPAQATFCKQRWSYNAARLTACAECTFGAAEPPAPCELHSLSALAKSPRCMSLSGQASILMHRLC